MRYKTVIPAHDASATVDKRRKRLCAAILLGSSGILANTGAISSQGSPGAPKTTRRNKNNAVVMTFVKPD